MGFGRLRLTTQLTVLVITTTLIALSLVVLLLLARAQSIVEDAIIARNVQLLETTARQLVQPARESDILAARAIMAPLPHPGSIRRLALYSRNGLFLDQAIASDMPIGVRGGDEDLVREAIASGRVVERRTPRLITLVTSVRDPEQAERSIGVLAIDLPIDDIEQGLLRLRQLALLVAVPIVLVMALAAWAIARYTAGPLETLTRAAAAFGRGDLGAPVAVRRGGELGSLAEALRAMARDLHSSRAQIETYNQALEQRVADRTVDLEGALADLRASIGEREQLSAAIQELSSPVLPVFEGILVMPLVGAITGERANLLITSLLHAIEQQRADFVIMDVTGVPIVDTQVAKALLQAADAARLLGTRTILAGLRPELAQTIVGMGLDLSALVTQADLRSGVVYAMRQRQSRMSAA
jgi:anti-anti-sigma regulatory factor/HAMP domain-containing protein